MIDTIAPPSKRGEPVWAIATSYPPQGYWTEDDFFALDQHDLSKRMRELSNGFLEVLPTPTIMHQFIAQYLNLALLSFLDQVGDKGSILFAPLPVRLFPGTIREPDIMYFRPGSIEPGEKYPKRVDLVIEIVSGTKKDRSRNLVIKRKEYAQAKISEYWIVDSETETIKVLTLPRGSRVYKTLGTFRRGQNAHSRLLRGFSVAVAGVMDAAKGV